MNEPQKFLVVLADPDGLTATYAGPFTAAEAEAAVSQFRHGVQLAAVPCEATVVQLHGVPGNAGLDA